MSIERTIYLDHHATTPVDPRVLEAMLPLFTEHFGNAASTTHAFGWEAEALVEQARERVADLIGAEAQEVIFTSGATESNNLAIRGVAHAMSAKGKHLVTMATEHNTVLDSALALEREGFEVTVLLPLPDGRIDLKALSDSLREDTILVSVMAANNEIGTVQPLSEISEIVRAHGAFLHTDAAQACAKIPVDVNEMGVDLLTLTAHKMNGPKGTGALYVRRRSPRVRLEAQMLGGGHERGLRSGTLNAPGIVGLGMACQIANEQTAGDAMRIGALRDQLLETLRDSIPGVEVNGTMKHRLANNLNVSLPGVKAETLIASLTDVALSTGSACTSSEQEPSHVLQAIGLSEERIDTSLRFGLGRFTTREEIETAAERVIEEYTNLRSMAPSS